MVVEIFSHPLASENEKLAAKGYNRQRIKEGQQMDVEGI